VRVRVMMMMMIVAHRVVVMARSTVTIMHAYELWEAGTNIMEKDRSLRSVLFLAGNGARSNARYWQCKTFDDRGPYIMKRMLLICSVAMPDGLTIRASTCTRTLAINCTTYWTWTCLRP
jgi:hypothetical protein